MFPKHLKIPLILLSSFSLLIILAPTVQAAQASILPACVAEGYCTLCDMMQLVINFGKFLLGIVGSLALLMFVYGGFIWLTSGGESGKIDAGKKILINSVIGVAITFFAWVIVAFVVSTLTAGNPGFKWDATLTCAPLLGLEPANVDLERLNAEFGTGPNQNKCNDDQSKPCGPYKDAAGVDCVGQKCDVASKVCVNTGGTWACGSCKALNADCADNRECCDGLCSPDKKCAKSTGVPGGFGTYCDKTHPCVAGLICQTNFSNFCTFGLTGSPCGGNSAECANGFHCQTNFGNNCAPDNTPFAPCDVSTNCPAGYSCLDAVRICSEGQPCWTPYGCKNTSFFAAWPFATKVCTPPEFKGYCHCGNDSDCNGVTYEGVSAPKCYTTGANQCMPGKVGNLCDKQGECLSGLKCMTQGKNMCTQGKVGEGCDDNSECVSGKCYKDTLCVPAGFTPPPPPADVPAANPADMPM